jgi:uncharacterized cupredoxin-like copper-binding protein
MKSTRLAAVIGTVAITAAGLATLAGCGTTAAKAPAAAATPAATATPADPSYSYYQTMMGRLYGGGTMMGGGSYRWMTGATGYQWMMGGAGAPAWMRGQALPGFMMGTSGDPGQVMGSLFANAPGARVSAVQATRLGSQIPADATLDRAANGIIFTGTSVRLTVVASPAGGPGDTFRIAGLTDPAITVATGAQVSIEVINADPGTAHGLVITAGGNTSAPMPMMTARPAFPGSAVWFLGNPTTAGMHAVTLTFTASAPGYYRYLCPVPEHAQKGMTGTFTVG